MPTGPFPALDDTRFGGAGGGGTSGGSLTGTGAPSQRPTLSPGSAPWSNGPTPPAPNWTTAPWSSNSSNPSSPTNPTTSRGLFGALSQGGYGAISSFFGGSQSSPTSTTVNPLSGVTQLVNTLYGPQQTILDQQLARQYDQLGLINQDADYRSDALTRDNALAQQLLGLDRQGLGNDASLIQGQMGNLERLRGILGQQRGLTHEQLQNQLAQLGIDEEKVRDLSSRELFDLRSQLTARGAYNTVANERGTGRINRDLDYALRTIGNQRGAADINFRNALLGLDEKGIGYDNQALGLNNRLSAIGLDMSRLGISEQQLANSLEDGLYQIGLESVVSVNGLLDAIGSTNAQQAQLAADILSQTLSYANLPPDVLAQIRAALGITPQAPAPPGGRAPTRPGLQL